MRVCSSRTSMSINRRHKNNLTRVDSLAAWEPSVKKKQHPPRKYLKYLAPFFACFFGPCFYGIFYLCRARANWIWEITSAPALPEDHYHQLHQRWARHVKSAPWATTKSWQTSLTSWRRIAWPRRPVPPCRWLPCRRRARNSIWTPCRHWPITCSFKSYDSVSCLEGITLRIRNIRSGWTPAEMWKIYVWRGQVVLIGFRITFPFHATISIMLAYFIHKLFLIFCREKNIIWKCYFHLICMSFLYFTRHWHI